MRVWSSKYALTQGIMAMDVEPCPTDPEMVKGVLGHYRVYLHPGEWHPTLEAAQEEAEQMRQRKIKSLERQLTRMKALRFNECNEQVQES